MLDKNRDAISPPFSYYGSKHRLSLKYPAPETSTIIEPFAGTAAYARRYWQPGIKVKLFDINPVVAGVWEWLIGADYDDVMQLPLIRTKEDLQRIQNEHARNLVAFNLNAASTSPAKSPSKWMLSGVRKGYWGEARRKKLAESVHVFDDWQITCCSYEDVDTSTDGTWFVDPPYQGKRGSHYKFGSNEIDYKKLGQWVQKLSSQLIVCEGNEAQWLDFEPLATCLGASRAKTVEKVFLKGCTNA